MKIPELQQGEQRIIILGMGFAGLKIARRLANNKRFQLLLIDKNNYHQFQPLLYQVATAGLEPSSISFPLRKIFQKKNNVFIRIAEFIKLDAETKTVITSIGDYSYDKLIIALGTTTNYFGNKQLSENCIGLKTVSEAMYIRNRILKNYENALVAESSEERETALNLVIVGGGPTGVELAGAIAEMKNNILPKDYPELDFSKMTIYLIEAVDRLLNSMSQYSSNKAKKYLEKLGVKILLNTKVDAFDGNTISTSQDRLYSSCVIWAAGISGTGVEGLPSGSVLSNGRIMVNEYNEVKSVREIFAIGDIAIYKSPENPNGHPQVAPVAIQQSENLADNLKRSLKNKPLKPFTYIDKGSMATVGRNKAVVELSFLKFGGTMAWLTWMFVHLMSIIGIKNRFFIFINWVYNYFTFNLSLRLILKERK